MNQAQELFEKLSSFKSSDEFIEYCSEVLGGVERIHVDFKQKQDSRNSKLDESDKKNLAKAVSGFANSGGGVLVWGIEDKTLTPKPIAAVQHFLQDLLQLAPQTTDPIVGKIDGNWILSDANPKEGFALLLVPESDLPPHRVILNVEGVKNHYYIRSGNSFMPASHIMLEDMFGRRPRPELSIAINHEISGSAGDQLWLTIFLGIENSGRGVAKSPFLEIDVNPPYEISNNGINGNMDFGMPQLATLGGSKTRRYGSTQSLVIHSSIIHVVTAIRIELFLSTAKMMSDILIDYKIAAENVQLIKGRKTINIPEVLLQHGYQIN